MASASSKGPDALDSPTIALLYSGNPMHESGRFGGEWASKWYDSYPDGRPENRVGALRRSIADLAKLATPSLFVFAAGYSSTWKPFVDNTLDLLAHSAVSEECTDRPFDAQFTNLYCAVLMMRARERSLGTRFRFAARMRTDVPITFRKPWFGNRADADQDSLLLTSVNALQSPGDSFTTDECATPAKRQGTFYDIFFFGSSRLLGDIIYYARPLSSRTERNLFQILVFLNATYSPVDITSDDTFCQMCGEARVRVNGTGIYCRPDLTKSWLHTCIMDWEQHPTLRAARRLDQRVHSKLAERQNVTMSQPHSRSALYAQRGVSYPNVRAVEPLPFDFPLGYNPYIPECAAGAGDAPAAYVPATAAEPHAAPRDDSDAAAPAAIAPDVPDAAADAASDAPQAVASSAPDADADASSDSVAEGTPRPLFEGFSTSKLVRVVEKLMLAHPDLAPEVVKLLDEERAAVDDVNDAFSVDLVNRNSCDAGCTEGDGPRALQPWAEKCANERCGGCAECSILPLRPPQG